MVRTISFLNFCLSSICFIFLTIPCLCFVPSRISWLTNGGGRSGSPDLPDDYALQNYHHSDNFLPFNSYRTSSSSMPLPLSRFMNVFNGENNQKKNIQNDFHHSIHHQYQQHQNDEIEENKFVSKRGERLCGVRLLKKMTAVCKNCIKSPDSSAITKRAGPADMTQFAAYCCSTGCGAEDFQQFCCN